jgi:hypothetical protein
LAFQLFISGPIIWAGWYYGHKSTSDLGTGHYNDEHKVTDFNYTEFIFD